MNAERLHAITLSLQKEVDQSHKLLLELTEALEKYVEDQTDAEAQSKLVSARTKINQALSHSVVESFSPAWLEDVASFNVEQLIGKKLLKEIDRIIDSNQMTPVVGLAELKELSEQVTTFSSATDSIIEGLSFYEIDDEILKPGECELGLLIPRAAVENHLEELGEEFVELNRFLSPFFELATGTRPPVTVRSISACDFGVLLNLSPDVAACIAKAIGWIIKTYQGILMIRKLRNQLLETGVATE
jgi:hypothetical protein